MLLEILILSRDVMRHEVCPFGLKINWTKTKIQTTVNDPSVPSKVMVARNAVVEKFTYLQYLGSHLDNTGGSDDEVMRRIALTRDCMDRNIWHYSITTATKIRLYSAYILVLPVLLYGAETWTLTKVLNKKIDSFD